MECERTISERVRELGAQLTADGSPSAGGVPGVLEGSRHITSMKFSSPPGRPVTSGTSVVVPSPPRHAGSSGRLSTRIDGMGGGGTLFSSSATTNREGSSMAKIRERFPLFSTPQPR